MSDHVGAVMRHYVIQLVDKLCNVCFKLKHLFLLSLHLVDNLNKNVDELGSEHHVRTHINESSCLFFERKRFSKNSCSTEPVNIRVRLVAGIV